MDSNLQNLELSARTRQTADAEFRKILHVLTHDLRSPLANARGLLTELRADTAKLEGMKPDAADPDGAARAASLFGAVCKDIPDTIGFIDQCVSRMDRVIRRTAEFATVAYGDLVCSAVDLGALMKELVASEAETLRLANCSVDLGPLPSVHGDPIALRRVFAELLANALASLLPERPGRIAIAGAAHDGAARIDVTDNGRGLPSKDCERIFLPLRQGSNAAAQADGMGLAIARAIARRHLGEIECSSQLGEGTTFTVTLPLAAASPA